MTEQLHVLGLYWGDGEPALFVRSRAKDGQEKRLPLHSGRHLRLAVRGPRRCVGYWHASNQRRHRCPAGRVLTGGRGGQCQDCERRGGGFYARTGILTEDNEHAAALRHEPHVAYLALFGRNLVKVGVTAEWRKLNRVLEQGATAALFFAAGDGEVIRRLEAELVRQAGLPDKVTLKQKLQLLWEQPDQPAAQAVLDRCLETTRNGCTPQQRAVFSTTPQFCYNLPSFNLDCAALAAGHLHLIRSVAEGDHLAGRIIGVVGCVVLLLGDDETPYALDARALQGYFITQSASSCLRIAAPLHTLTKPVAQDALF
jgi:uncharacterized protein DUF2797